MSLRKDKQKVLGESFDDERIKSFLGHIAPVGIALDYYLLEKAYRGMHEENYTTFIKFFVEAGHDLNSTGPDGKTFLQMIKSHNLAEGYVAAIESHNA